MSHDHILYQREVRKKINAERKARGKAHAKELEIMRNEMILRGLSKKEIDQHLHAVGIVHRQRRNR